MPVFEAHQTILKAIKSVLHQTYTNWELLVISDDLFNYKKYIDPFVTESRIRYATTNTIKSGPSNARNVGISHARGDYITFIDADDEFLPDRLKSMLMLTMKYGICFDNALVNGQMIRSLKKYSVKKNIFISAKLRAITKIHGKNEDNLQDMQGLRQKLPRLSRK